jgi:hypothetical protein
MKSYSTRSGDSAAKRDKSQTTLQGTRPTHITAAAIQMQQIVGNRETGRWLNATAQRYAKDASRTQPTIQRKHILKEDRDTALGRLQSTYPNMKDLSSNMGEMADQFWENHMKNGEAPMKMDELIEGILNNYLLEEERDYPITISFVYSSGEMNLNVTVKKSKECLEKEQESKNDNNEKIEEKLLALTQVFKEGSHGPVDVKIQTVTATERGGKPLFRDSLIPLYNRMGVQKITLSASGIGGRQDGIYAWVRYGFIPTAEDWTAMQSLGNRILKEEENELPHDILPLLNQIMKQQNPEAIRKLVHLSWERREDQSIASYLNRILTASGSWEGSLDLSDDTDRTWLLNYVNSLSPDVYKSLLPVLDQKDKNKNCLVM